MLVALLASGCATSYVRDTTHPQGRQIGPAFYPATDADVEFIWWALKGAELQIDPVLHGKFWVLTPFCVVGALVDLPFSLLLDTLFLPADIARHGDRKDRQTRDVAEDSTD